MNIKLSILILTHNRPKLFERCILSVLKNKPKNIEILVNNDSMDIVEIPGAKYYYKKDNNLANIYNFLFSKANGEFIYYLEDDDYVTKNFYSNIQYVNSIYKYIPEDITKIKKYFENFKNNNINDLEFIEYFQLGQILFKKSDIYNLPTNNNINNDLVFLKNITNWIFINKYIYIQTTDGQDNISFDHLNKDKRFKENKNEL